MSEIINKLQVTKMSKRNLLKGFSVDLYKLQEDQYSHHERLDKNKKINIEKREAS